jgi:hypothetical protein
LALELGARERVEAHAAGVVASDEDGLSAGARGLAAAPDGNGRPLGRMRGLTVPAQDVQLAACCLLDEVVVGVAAVDMREEGALARVALAHDLAQLDGPEPTGQRSQPAAGLDARELSGVADRDDFDPRRRGVLKDARRLARSGHAGLVEDQHGRSRSEAARVGVQIE